MNSDPILLIEDNADDELLTIRAIKKNNILNQVIVAHDGKEALELLFAEGENKCQACEPKVILLDLNLPKISGLDVLKAIREDQRTRNYPVVILTSSKEEEDIKKSYTLGANSYIRKPVDFDQFTDTIKQLGSYWLQLNETI
ncbi:MAG: response regulator [Bacteroidota bacterium]|nr:response regulator [Bacteroidota bacterium]MDP4227535.1 response regulator [Bacteroidota bacterium]MDP4273638.1 response regulator [Bacteroidota bacterium]